MSEASQTQKYDYIDALRGYAILGVIAVHAMQRSVPLPDVFVSLLGQGARGVQLFFVVSAVTLMMSMSRRDDGVESFYLRRFFRIAPMFWLAILVFYLLQGVNPRFGAPLGLEWWHFVLALTFLHGWYPSAITSVVPGSWSIAVEFTFYLLLPLITKYVRTLGAALLLTFATLVFQDWSYGKILSTLPQFLPEAESGLVSLFAFLWFFNQLPVFMLGIVTFYLIRDYKLTCHKYVSASALFVVLALMVAAPFLPNLYHDHIEYSVLFCALTYLFANGVHYGFVNPAINFLGKVSFSAYLIHFFLLAVFAKMANLGFDPLYFKQAKDNGLLYFLFFFPFLLLTTAALSYLTYIYVEKPGIKLGHQAVERFRRWRGVATPLV